MKTLMGTSFKNEGAHGCIRCAYVVLMAVAVVFLGMNSAVAVGFEAEGGTLGSNFSVIAGTPTYITISTDGSGENPGSSLRVASYVSVCRNLQTLRPRAGGGRRRLGRQFLLRQWIRREVGDC